SIVGMAGGGSQSLALIGNGAPFLTSSPASASVLAGGMGFLRAGASGAWPLSFQWQYNGTNLPAATNSFLLFTNVGLREAGVYSVIVSNAFGQVTNSSAKLAVMPALITNQPQTQVTWLASPVTFGPRAQF